jgi:predicted CoA-binding protein
VNTMKIIATDEIGELLKRTKTIAVVGLSDSPLRPSYGVSAYMQSHGYKIIPVTRLLRGRWAKRRLRR